LDSDGLSDPFVVIRYRGLEASSTTVLKTLNPEWGEVFTFRTPPGKDELDEEDDIELIVYDRDFALHDFIGYAKVDLSGTKVMTDAKPKHTREWKKLEIMPKDQAGDFFDLNHMKEKLMFWEGERPISGRVEIETWVWGGTVLTSFCAVKTRVFTSFCSYKARHFAVKTRVCGRMGAAGVRAHFSLSSLGTVSRWPSNVCTTF
jgi:hypothetical protein